MMKNNIAGNEKTVGAGIGGGTSVDAAVICVTSLIPVATVIAPVIVPIIMANGVVGAVGRWLGRD